MVRIAASTTRIFKFKALRFSGRDRSGKGAIKNRLTSCGIGDNTPIMKFSDIVVGKTKDFGKNFVGVLA